MSPPLQHDPLFSGRLLTIEARVTRENIDSINSASGDRGEGKNTGWVTTRSTTRTHAAARSFILPDDVSNEVNK